MNGKVKIDYIVD